MTIRFVASVDMDHRRGGGNAFDRDFRCLVPPKERMMLLCQCVLGRACVSFPFLKHNTVFVDLHRVNVRPSVRLPSPLITHRHQTRPITHQHDSDYGKSSS